MISAFAVGLCMTANVFLPGQVMAQVPNYVPTNGLIAWYPFNGNANDESGNGNNGTVNGATLTTDRFGNVNKAYSFDGVDDKIQINQVPFTNGPFTFNCWYKISQLNAFHPLISFGELGANGLKKMYVEPNYSGSQNPAIGTAGANAITNSSAVCQINTWQMLTVVFSGYNVNNVSFYLNGQFLGSNTSSGANVPTPFNSSGFTFGSHFAGQNGGYLGGVVDDYGIWNRALTLQEIYDLYFVCNGNEITSQPINSVNTIGTNAQFSVNALNGSTYQWQSNPLNTGWLNLTNNSTYSGVTSNTLNVSNTTISNHNQPFRAIVNAGGCVDTSIVAQIIIGDSCLTTVTDTLIINTTLSLPAPNNQNTILIYPNPASDHITIDNGNYVAMAGYTIKIENNAGQQVFQSLINQAQFYVDLSTWTGNGLYFVHLIDPQNNTLTVRKIVIQ